MKTPWIISLVLITLFTAVSAFADEPRTVEFMQNSKLAKLQTNTIHPFIRNYAIDVTDEGNRQIHIGSTLGDNKITKRIFPLSDSIFPSKNAREAVSRDLEIARQHLESTGADLKKVEVVLYSKHRPEMRIPLSEISELRNKIDAGKYSGANLEFPRGTKAAVVENVQKSLSLNLTLIRHTSALVNKVDQKQYQLHSNLAMGRKIVFVKPERRAELINQLKHRLSKLGVKRFAGIGALVTEGMLVAGKVQANDEPGLAMIEKKETSEESAGFTSQIK